MPADESNRIKKQAYLKEQMFVNNLDGNEFADFLAERRDNGSLNRHGNRLLGSQ